MLSFSSNELEKAPNQEYSFKINELIDLDSKEYRTKDNVVGEVTFKYKNSFLLVSGNFKSSLVLLCDRCTSEYETTITSDISEAIRVMDSEQYEDEIEFNADDIYEQVKPDEQINIADYIRQYIILNVPTKRICSDTCTNKDLSDLNERHESKIDPRWENLILNKENYKGD